MQTAHIIRKTRLPAPSSHPDRDMLWVILKRPKMPLEGPLGALFGQLEAISGPPGPPEAALWVSWAPWEPGNH
eukprot:6706683-Pyramimonas_sp.AAC.1